MHFLQAIWSVFQVSWLSLQTLLVPAGCCCCCLALLWFLGVRLFSQSLRRVSWPFHLAFWILSSSDTSEQGGRHGLRTYPWEHQHSSPWASSMWNFIAPVCPSPGSQSGVTPSCLPNKKAHKVLKLYQLKLIYNFVIELYLNRTDLPGRHQGLWLLKSDATGKKAISPRQHSHEKDTKWSCRELGDGGYWGLEN